MNFPEFTDDAYWTEVIEQKSLSSIFRITISIQTGITSNTICENILRTV